MDEMCWLWVSGGCGMLMLGGGVIGVEGRRGEGEVRILGGAI